MFSPLARHPSCTGEFGTWIGPDGRNRHNTALRPLTNQLACSPGWCRQLYEATVAATKNALAAPAPPGSELQPQQQQQGQQQGAGSKTLGEAEGGIGSKPPRVKSSVRRLGEGVRDDATSGGAEAHALLKKEAKRAPSLQGQRAAKGKAPLAVEPFAPARAAF